ncbi:hypothetical protein, partial [Halalkalibacterium halodurans]|uniref:hypothetical protein n=1 Tax=Halalkalibacterium halodurans TaxID=86665 RepID=UPI002AAA367F
MVVHILKKHNPTGLCFLLGSVLGLPLSLLRGSFTTPFRSVVSHDVYEENGVVSQGGMMLFFVVFSCCIHRLFSDDSAPSDQRSSALFSTSDDRRA